MRIAPQSMSMKIGCRHGHPWANRGPFEEGQ